MKKETIKTEILIIGAGVIGLSIAKYLSKNFKVIVLEKNSMIGDETSSRNSGVIHAGIYYKEGSMKARFCLRGKELLYEYLNQNDLPFKRCGKLIIASSKKDQERLEKLYKNGINNGVKGLELINEKKAKILQSDINIDMALYSKTTGIFDVPEYIRYLDFEVNSNGGIIGRNSCVQAIEKNNQNFNTTVKSGNEIFVIESEFLINAAGLNSVEIAKKINGINNQILPKLYFAKGHYYKLTGSHPFKGPLIYPVNNKDGLGIHLTLDMNGDAKFGPDVEWVNKIDYSFNSSKKKEFIKSIRKYYPDLDPKKLHEDYTGIRPKLQSPASGPKDFLIHTEENHKLKGLINLFGIESPGLTASLGIGEYIRQLI